MSKRVMAAIAALSISGSAALAQEVKVGVVLPYTGIGAEFARQMDRGMELYLKLNPATIAQIRSGAGRDPRPTRGSAPTLRLGNA
jgi:ABC-type sugar transport system substrate-binding protein